MEIVKILLIAIGGYGANYIKEMTEKNVTSAVIEGICEVMPDIDEKFPVIKEHNIPVYKSPENFYKEHEADLAIISTPMHLHFSQAKFCLEHGSNVLLEKPVCTNLEDARKLMELEKQTGHFVAVGYQQNFAKDVLALKQDIINGEYGKPILMKTMHALKRGEKYYHRNNWAGKITVNGCPINDSPFNNACAHQFQNMSFLLGKTIDQAAELSKVEGELYRANANVENYDTAAVHAVTSAGVPIYYYTTHDLDIKELGPIAEYRFEHATIYLGRDFGNGPVKTYVAVMNDGTVKSYESISKGERLQKFYDAIECTKDGGHPVCTVQCAIPHLEAVLELAKLPIHQIKEDALEHIEEDGDQFCRIRDLREVFKECYTSQLMPSEADVNW